MKEERNFLRRIRQRPQAIAEIHGSAGYPELHGIAAFYSLKEGVLTAIQVSGLPENPEPCHSPVFAVHIHSGDSCTGNSDDPFADALSHYNPQNCPHPYHAGDLPPLFGVNGFAFSAVLTNRFSMDEILGKTVIIHRNPDDFTTQPSGNSGAKIACGVIRRFR